MNVEGKARVYVNKTFPEASAWEREKIVDDWISKERKTAGLVADFEKRAGSIEGKNILEIGFGSGIQMLVFSKAGAHVSGLEVDETLYEIGKEVLEDTDATIKLYDGRAFPFEDNSFEYCYATSVLEHVSDVPQVLREACRVLKPGGRFYVSFPNKWWPKETHTGIYFLSFLPRTLASFVVRKVFKRNTVEEWNLHFLSYFTLKRILREHHIAFDIVFETQNQNPLRHFIKETLRRLGVHHSAVLATVMVVLEKRK